MSRWPILDVLPKGRVLEEAPRGVLVVREAFAEAFHAAGFHAGRGEPPAVSDLAGRRPLGELVVGGERLVVRRFHHGGMLRWVTGHRFADPERPFRELVLSARLEELGVATPEVIAARARRARVGGWILDLVTRRVEGARDFAEWLEALREGRVSPRERRETARRVGAFIGRFHSLGLWHADLNPRNLLLIGEGEEVAVQVLDLDRSVLRPTLQPDERRSNLARLLRAVLRREGRGATFLSRADLGAFLRGYLEGASAKPLAENRAGIGTLGEEWRGVAVAYERSAGSHRMWWKVEEAFGGGAATRDGRAIVRRES